MKRILFVDDEQNILDALQRMLRPMRHEWEMVFVNGGAEALAALAEKRFDVMISDMRMPGMNGAQLMAEVMARQPQAVRIILSGYSDQELTLKSAGLVHQYLAKPCEAEEIKMIVGRACALRDLLADESLKQLVSRVKSLPSPPSVYAELLKEMESLDASIRKIGEVISRDVAMTAKVLQLVNSAFFGIRRQIGSPAEAISLLGLDTVMKLTLMIHVFTQFDRRLAPGFSPEALISHSLRVGLFARRIAQAEGADSELTNDAFSGGLLHDVGRLVMVANLPQQYARMLELLREPGRSPDEAEREAFGAAHSEVGAYLLGLWGLPRPIIEAVAFHHQPAKSLARDFCPVTAVHVANVIEHELRGERAGDAASAESFDPAYLTEIGVADRIDVWRAICARASSEETL